MSEFNKAELLVAIDSLRYDISKLNTWNVRSPNDIEYYDDVLAQLFIIIMEQMK